MIDLKNLSKKFKNTLALNTINLQIQKGEVLGILGPNGSGKTTLINLILGLLKPTSGSISIDNQDSWNDRQDTIKKISYVMETPRFYPDLSATQNLEIIRRKLDIHPAKVDEILEKVDLNSTGEKAFSTFSLGMKQRLSIASALLKDPEILIVDEPTNGLDPEGIIQIRELIISLAGEGRILILCSHMISEVQKICKRVVILNEGSIIKDTNITNMEKDSNSFILECSDKEDLSTALSSLKSVLNFQKNDLSYSVQLEANYSAADLNKDLAKKNIYLSLLKPKENNLEHLFLESINTPIAGKSNASQN